MKKQIIDKVKSGEINLLTAGDEYNLSPEEVRDLQRLLDVQDKDDSWLVINEPDRDFFVAKRDYEDYLIK